MIGLRLIPAISVRRSAGAYSMGCQQTPNICYMEVLFATPGKVLYEKPSYL